jgi:hypothetical protein
MDRSLGLHEDRIIQFSPFKQLFLRGDSQYAELLIVQGLQAREYSAFVSVNDWTIFHSIEKVNKLLV